jgi:hypothetical protein
VPSAPHDGRPEGGADGAADGPEPVERPGVHRIASRSAVTGAARFVVLATLAGALLAVPTGWAWVALADPPSVPMGAHGISYGEQQMNALAGVPGWFAVLGVLVGVVGGTVIAVAGRRFGWAVVVATVGFTLAAGTLTRYTGTHWFGPDVRDQLRHAHRGEQIQLAVHLGSRGPLLVWPVGGLAAVVAVVATWWPRSGQAPSVRRPSGARDVSRGQ